MPNGGPFNDESMYFFTAPGTVFFKKKNLSHYYEDRFFTMVVNVLQA